MDQDVALAMTPDIRTDQDVASAMTPDVPMSGAVGARHLWWPGPVLTTSWKVSLVYDQGGRCRQEGQGPHAWSLSFM